MTTIADMLTIKDRRRVRDREDELRVLAAELRKIPRQLPPAVPVPLHVIALRRALQAPR